MLIDYTVLSLKKEVFLLINGYAKESSAKTSAPRYSHGADIFLVYRLYSGIANCGYSLHLDFGSGSIVRVQEFMGFLP